MADEPVELAAKDVFVLLGVPVPENLETGSKWQEQGDTKDDDDESHFSLDEDDKVQINVSNISLIANLLRFLCRRMCYNL